MNYKQLYKYIKSLFHSYFRNKYKITDEDKEDIIQDVMIAIHTKIKEGKLSEDIEEIKNYIFITTKNHLTSRIDRAYYRKIVLYDNFDLFELICDEDIEDQLSKEMLLDRLKIMLDNIKITKSQRLIFENYMKGYSVKELTQFFYDIPFSKIRNDITGTIIKLKNEYSKKKYYKVFKVDGSSRYYYFKDMKDAAVHTGSYSTKVKKLIDENGYAIINGWKIHK